MEKSKQYKNAWFDAKTIKHVLEVNFDNIPFKDSYRLRRDVESWEFDDEREFFAEYRKEHTSSAIRKSGGDLSVTINYTQYLETVVSVQAKSRGEIEDVFEIFENSYEASIVVNNDNVKSERIFIGHGRNSQWRDLKDHLSDKHGYSVESYETGARAGHLKVVLRY